MGAARKNDDMVAASMKMPRQHLPHLSTATRNDNAQRTHDRKMTCGHQGGVYLNGY